MKSQNHLINVTVIYMHKQFTYDMNKIKKIYIAFARIIHKQRLWFFCYFSFICQNNNLKKKNKLKNLPIFHLTRSINKQGMS